MTRISVVVPMYNAQAWIEATLESVAAQTYPAELIETVIVDDCSRDDSVAIARAFLARRGMRGVVIESERNRGVGAARNAGWRAASGEWVQFLDADDLLAPDKLELQARVVAGAADDVAVICSSWQRLTRDGDAWTPSGPVVGPDLDRSVILSVVALNAGFLGPALIRRRVLEAVSGFTEQVKYAEDSYLMLKIVAAGGRFVETPTAAPMFFIRQTPLSKSRSSWGKVARQHMENIGIAERLLRERNGGSLSPEDAKGLIHDSGWAVSELYEHDRAAFHRYLEWIRALDPAFVPDHSAKLRLATRVLGYENAEGVAWLYRRVRGWLGMLAGLFPTRPAAGSGSA